ncbi:TetR/AcrR family transcriptional regulator [Duganella sp. HH105]|uniref:TetR/AcrR family transcriptional regulator n=1 Tax=Duganella sp. HH105 TaxID=1781067 RepID=UPI000877E33C|nr:TetR/AcrR family transcriptional regulator [Duganella sp. HH105]OEZ63777.1 putative HTH-type transcriptional regulator YfiR [Duganella sp. HH105]
MAESRKQLIVEAACACFLRKGYHQTGVRDIAAEAGISLGNLYNHFAGKDAVLAEIAALEAEELTPFLARLQAVADPAEAVMGFVAAYLDYASRPEHALMTLELVAESVRNPAIAQTFGGNRDGLLAALGALLAAGAAAGRLRSLAHPAETARLLLDLVEGHALRVVLGDTAPDAVARDEVMNFIAHSIGIA